MNTPRQKAELVGRIRRVAQKDFAANPKMVTDTRRAFTLLEKLLAKLPPEQREQTKFVLYAELQALIAGLRLDIAKLLGEVEFANAAKDGKDLGDEEYYEEVYERMLAFATLDEHQWK
jgi:hypothetical protein